MDDSRTLPLFPLGTVLFPGVVLPLHVFEERYKLMIRRCLESDRRLGIVLIRKGWEVGEAAIPFDVGTLARITRVETLSDGKLNLAVAGERRFRIRRLLAGEPYARADVEVLEDGPLTVSDSVIAGVRQQFTEYVQTLRRLSRRVQGPVRLPDGPVEISHAVGANLQINRTEQQALLEQPVGPRLVQELEILRRELTLLQRLGAVSSRRAHAPHEVPLN